MRNSTKKLLVYGGVAAAAYYFFMRPKPMPAPAAAPPTGAVAGLGYFPSGSDRPFARIYNGHPTAWARTHSW
jgi:hypothetical protein